MTAWTVALQASLSFSISHEFAQTHVYWVGDDGGKILDTLHINSMLLMFKYIHWAGTFYLSKSKFQEQGLRNVESAVHQYKAYRWKGGMKWTGLSETKRCLLLGRKVMTNLDSILKSRDITLPTKVCLFKAMVFPVVMYGCESWTLKKSEHRRIDAFELWCWRRLWESLGLQGDPTSPSWRR